MSALDDLVVIDLSTGIAGAYCTKLLADAGARVVKVEPPEGDPLRSWSASGAAIPPDGEGALYGFLLSSKDRLVVDPDDSTNVQALHDLLAGAHAVVWSHGSRLAEDPVCAPDALTADHPHLTVTSITPFGLTGPWSGRPATELTLQAWSGAVVGLGRGSPDRPPVHVGGQIGEWLSGVYAAIGTLASRARGGHELVDVSMLETLALSLTYYPVTFHDIVGRPFRSGRSIVTPGVEATKDGLVGLGVGTGQQWLDFCVMVEHPEWTEDRKLFANRAHLAPEIARWAAERTTAEILELASLWRIPHAPIGNGATIPRTDHFAARRSIVENPRTGIAEPDRPYRFDPPLLEGSDEAAVAGEPTLPPVTDALPYAGLRVLDLTAFWAGPLCTHVLAMLGAEVIHVESTARPDGTRLLAGLRFSEPDWWEQSGIFSGLNVNKQGITLDLAKDEGRGLLRRLLATCDVVVENYTPRVLEQLGFGAAAVRAIRPDIIMVRMPGFGLDGPWRENPAFAFVIEDAAGLTWRTGFPDAPPISPYCVGDSNAGIHAACALLLAVEHRRRTGEGVLVEAAMVDAALNVGAEQIVEHAAYGALLQREGNRGPLAAPQNLYLASDAGEDGARDTWVAVAVADDDQWHGLRRALGEPAWATDRSLDDHQGRRARHDDIDEQLGAWCAERRADDIVELLWDAGVPVAKVVQPHDQADLPPFQHRGFFESVDHPVAGTARHSTLPFRSSRGPERYHRRHAPLLGEHTEEVLRSLGVSDADLERLEADGVIGTAPAAAKASK